MLKKLTIKHALKMWVESFKKKCYNYNLIIRKKSGDKKYNKNCKPISLLDADLKNMQDIFKKIGGLIKSNIHT